jgi:YebC/PmpR family DNA-binding regulatory protein
MSGHSKWKQIKHKKEATDQARGKLFSKLANAISIAAQSGTDPQFNHALKNAIEQAKRHHMPQTNIDRAINKFSEEVVLENLLLEVYGPNGTGILIEIETDNKNRVLGEIKAILKQYDAKLAEPGSLVWSFEKTIDGTYFPKFQVSISDEIKDKLVVLINLLKIQNGVVGVFSTANLF